jgi:TPP-dependent pyruvate/acetoin dehydrogenase alpha subunit
VEAWKAKDPIPAMERYLAGQGLWQDSWKQELSAQFAREIDEAVEFAEKSPLPEPGECLDHVYSFSIRERELNRKEWTASVASPAGGTSKT